jgi:hypothetical protein
MNNTFAFNDPLIGETHISAEKLNAVWQANGGCGLVVLPECETVMSEATSDPPIEVEVVEVHVIG